MTVKRQSYAQFEVAEEKGTISVASMRRAAEAMNCELIYYIVPRESAARSYLELAQVHDPAALHLRATDHSAALTGSDPHDNGG
jgi:hypothetical protein